MGGDAAWLSSTSRPASGWGSVMIPDLSAGHAPICHSVITVGVVSWLSDRLARCQEECGSPDPALCLPDDAEVSHYGIESKDPPFRNFPRARLEPGMSVQAQRMTAEEICETVHGTPTQTAMAEALVRHTTVGVLRAKGFVVLHTPGMYSYQKKHATVAWPDEDHSIPDVVQSKWPTEVRDNFDSCFNTAS